MVPHVPCSNPACCICSASCHVAARPPHHAPSPDMATTSSVIRSTSHAQRRGSLWISVAKELPLQSTAPCHRRHAAASTCTSCRHRERREQPRPPRCCFGAPRWCSVAVARRGAACSARAVANAQRCSLVCLAGAVGGMCVAAGRSDEVQAAGGAAEWSVDQRGRAECRAAASRRGASSALHWQTARLARQLLAAPDVIGALVNRTVNIKQFCPSRYRPPCGFRNELCS